MLEVWQETEAAMRPILIILFSLILVGMLTITTIATLDRGIFSVGSELLSDRWFQATLADAYFGFITFYVWVAYKEATIARRVIWFVLIMTLGNIAMSIYVLIQLARMNSGDGWPGLLLRGERS
jgi:hypothetical protein